MTAPPHQLLLRQPPQTPLRAARSLNLRERERAWLDLCPAGSPKNMCTTYSSHAGREGRKVDIKKQGKVIPGKEACWPTGPAFRELFAGILWARNNCLGLAAQLPEAQISDPRGLDTPSMGTWPGTPPPLPLPLLPPPPGSGSFLQENCGEPIWTGAPCGFCSPWLGSVDRGPVWESTEQGPSEGPRTVCGNPARPYGVWAWRLGRNSREGPQGLSLFRMQLCPCLPRPPLPRST